MIYLSCGVTPVHIKQFFPPWKSIKLVQSSHHAAKMKHSLYLSALVPVTHNSYFHKSETPKGFWQVLPQKIYFQQDKLSNNTDQAH